ncbi:hypothetical protein [uncultured Subdoligranulum sp.]|uniref:Uncharacterized protein n=1 Tax=Candidatus Gemmiger excrementavium TaxID=2838608 RepID=A0A9D2F250_9FIRM|nr:hypothetical protein [uncultured Subdoligranulum sp.]HIZ48134.1 hypothetical protein [Candidatus Gemmiger excrementavium]
MEQTARETLATYQRDYSELEGLQKADRVTYSLRRGQRKLWFCAARRASRAVTRCALCGMDEAFARLVLQYIYENGVEPEQLPEVLHDLCGSAV